jgi:hypothetical protein
LLQGVNQVSPVYTQLFPAAKIFPADKDDIQASSIGCEQTAGIEQALKNLVKGCKLDGRVQMQSRHPKFEWRLNGFGGEAGTHCKSVGYFSWHMKLS